VLVLITAVTIKSRIMRWAGHVARMGERKCLYRVLVGRPEGGTTWKTQTLMGGYIKMDLQEMGCGG